MYDTTLTIGNLTLDSRCVLSPLAGISDLAFRLLNREFGCRLAFVEMFSAKSLIRQTRTSQKLLQTDPADTPLGIQLVGRNADDLRHALDIIAGYPFQVIDFNAACPVRKVIRRGEGAHLLQEPQHLEALLKTMVDCSPVPVTLKIRSGWDGASINAPELARRAQDAGVQAVCVHGRTRAQLYRGRVCYGSIRQVKQAVSIPVIGSGDVFSPELAVKMLAETGCDGVAVARGAFGNPWIFRQTDALLHGGEVQRPGLSEIMETMLRHLDMCVGVRGEAIGVLLFRKFFSWYTRGFYHIKPLRAKAFCARARSEMQAIIHELPLLKGAQAGPVAPQYPWSDIAEE